MCFVLRGSDGLPKLPLFAGILTWEPVPLMCGRQAQPPPWLHLSAAYQHHTRGWMAPVRTFQDELLPAPLPEVRIPANREFPQTC